MNTDAEVRERIIFGEPYNKENYLGGIRSFYITLENGINLRQLEELIEKRFVEMDGCHNDSPTTNEFYEFMKKYPQCRLEGYTVSPDRQDYRTTFDGIYCTDKITPELKEAFAKTFLFARYVAEYTFEDDILRAWWD